MKLCVESELHESCRGKLQKHDDNPLGLHCHTSQQMLRGHGEDAKCKEAGAPLPKVLRMCACCDLVMLGKFIFLLAFAAIHIIQGQALYICGTGRWFGLFILSNIVGIGFCT